jgi:serine/threonine-protein kinase
MGTVYSGSDEALKRAVAVKLIRHDLAGNRDFAARFLQEARAAAGIAHRNVVTIHDFGVEREHPFIIMELLAGRTLRAELGAAKPLSTERTLEIMSDVCAAIEEAHSRQFIHRDLKPENIFLAQSPRGDVAKILDFGLVKALSISTPSNATTATTVVAGTPYYMAPEQLLGEAPAHSWDLWALGVIAYEMLVGKHPFVSDKQNGLAQCGAERPFYARKSSSAQRPATLGGIFRTSFPTGSHQTTHFRARASNGVGTRVEKLRTG